MTWWSWLLTGLKWICFGVGCLVIFLLVLVVIAVVIDSLTRRFIDSNVSMQFDPNYHRGETSTLIVYLPGLLGHGEISSRELQEVWKEFGTFAVVNYDGDRFRPNQVVREVSGALGDGFRARKFTQLVLIGSSMGGLLAHGVHHELRRRFLEIPTSIIALDAPTRSNDLQAPLNWYAAVFRFLPAGPAFNLLPVTRIVLPMPKQNSLEPSVIKNPHNLKTGVAYSQSRKTSYYLDQVAYIASQRGLADGSLRHCRVVYVRSTNDVDTVRQTAFQQWNDAVCGQAHYIEVPAKHVAYAESPSVYRNVAFPKAFDALGMQRQL